MTELSPLLKAYKELGAGIPYWTQGQGSNLSYKNRVRRTLWIKPSGFRLDQVQSESDLVEINLSLLPQNWSVLNQTQYSQIIQSAKVGSTPLRPSMETGFHAALDSAYVLHFHSLVSVLMSHQEAVARPWLTQNWEFGEAHFIDYVTPGLDLTNKISKFPEGSLFFLKQHGVILAGENLSILEKWISVEKKWMREFHNQEWPMEEFGLQKSASFRKGPLRVLFPDMAVYLQKVISMLENDGEQWVLKPDAEERDRNLAELWIATQILQRFEGGLPEIEEQEIQNLTQLPTEQYRLLTKK